MRTRYTERHGYLTWIRKSGNQKNTKIDDVLIRLIMRKGEFCPVRLVQPHHSLLKWMRHDKKVRVIVFITIFKNILIISWWSVLLVSETEYPDITTDLSLVTNKLYHIILYRVHLSWGRFEHTPSLVITIVWTDTQDIERLCICVLHVSVSGLSLFNDLLIDVYCLAPLSAIFQLYHCEAAFMVEEYRGPGENHQPRTSN